MSFDQWQPADPKHPVNSADRYGHAFADSSNPNWDPYAILSSGQGDAKYPINASVRNDSNHSDTTSTAWDPYEALLILGRDRPGVINEYPNETADRPTFNPLDKGPDAGSFLSKLGFPTPDLSGFDQEAPNHEGGFWHGLKHLFVRDETNDEKVHDAVLKNLSHNPQEQKQYDQEEQSMKEYKSKLLGWESQANINPGPPPSPPDCPMHQEVEKRVQNAEKQITAQVEASMSPQDRQRLRTQMDQYERARTEHDTIHNPMGTGEGLSPMPVPGNAILDYYDRIGEATEKYCNDQT